MSMRPQKKRISINFKQLVVLGLSGSFGIFLGWTVEHAAVSGEPVNPVVLFVCLFVAVFIHELGHVAGGLAVRYEVMSFSVGPLMLRKEPKGLRFRRSPIRVGGLVTAVPIGTEDLLKRMLIFIAAGPISSFISAGLAFILAYALTENGLSDWLSTYAVTSAGLGVLSLIPMRKFYLSDGARIWELLRHPAKAERRCAAAVIAAVATKGVRPKDWDATIIEKALSLADGSGTDVAANALAYEWAMDRREFEVAEKHLGAALALLDTCPVTLKAGLALDAAFFYAMARDDGALAREWLNTCNRRYIHERYSLLMVDAAVLLTESNWSEAARKAEEAILALPQAQFPGFAVAANDWLQTIVERTRGHLDSVGAQSVRTASVTHPA